MKAIFLGSLHCPSASGHQRLWALRQCGVEVNVIDTANYPNVLKRLSSPLAKLLRNPRWLRDGVRLERDLIERSEEFGPDLIWLEWPREIRPEVIRRLHALKNHPYIISFQDDNPWGARQSERWLWRDYLKLAPLVDLHLVKRRSDIENLKALGAKNCRIWEHGVYTPLYHPPEPAVQKQEKIYPVSFVGTCMDQRPELIGHLLENNIPINVFGNFWNKRSALPARFPQAFHPAVHGVEYAEVLRRSLICLGLVSHSNLDEWTMRTYEVPGCASLLLAERTDTHEAWFQDGQEAVFFSNPDECLRKVQDLLKSPERCRAMGAIAYQKCLDSNWLIEKRMAELLQELPNQHAEIMNFNGIKH